MKYNSRNKNYNQKTCLNLTIRSRHPKVVQSKKFIDYIVHLRERELKEQSNYSRDLSSINFRDSFGLTAHYRGASELDANKKEYSWQRNSDVFSSQNKRSSSLFSTELYLQDKKRQLDALYDKYLFLSLFPIYFFPLAQVPRSQII